MIDENQTKVTQLRQNSFSGLSHIHRTNRTDWRNVFFQN